MHYYYLLLKGRQILQIQKQTWPRVQFQADLVPDVTLFERKNKSDQKVWKQEEQPCCHRFWSRLIESFTAFSVFYLEVDEERESLRDSGK